MRKQYVVDLIAQIVPGRERVQTARLIVERLSEEGLLVLGHGDTDVDQIVMAFSEMFGTTKTTRYDRYAANRMAKAHGTRSVLGVIKMLGERQEEQYVPVVGSVRQLEDKWVSVLAFLRRQNNDEIIQL